MAGSKIIFMMLPVVLSSLTNCERHGCVYPKSVPIVIFMFPSVLASITKIQEEHQVLSNTTIHRHVTFHASLCSGGGKTDNLPMRIRSVKIPSLPEPGTSIELTCMYDLGNETLYAVKWYKNTKEFYRYVPKSEPQFKAFIQSGVDVDIGRSNRTSVVLTNIHPGTSGFYTCQVSGDSPYYVCVQATEYMDVYFDGDYSLFSPIPTITDDSDQVPTTGPVVAFEPVRDRVVMGENVTIVCRLGANRIYSNVLWYINQELLDENHKWKKYASHLSGHQSCSMEMAMLMVPDMFETGRMVFKCTATEHFVQSASTKELITVVNSTCDYPDPCTSAFADALKMTKPGCFRFLVEYSLEYNQTDKKQTWEFLRSNCTFHNHEETDEETDNGANRLSMTSFIIIITAGVFLAI